MTSAALLVSLLVLAGPPWPDAATLARAWPPGTQGGTSHDVAIIVHRSNPVENLSRAELRRMFLLETQTWPRGRKITVVVREKGQPERAEALQAICDLNEAEYERHVLLQTFRGNVGWGPRSILSADAMRRFVFNVPGAIGYVWANETDDSVKVVRIDGLLPGEPGYPLRRRPGPSSNREP
jgi:hypothetical protein